MVTAGDFLASGESANRAPPSPSPFSKARRMTAPPEFIQAMPAPQSLGLPEHPAISQRRSSPLGMNHFQEDEGEQNEEEEEEEGEDEDDEQEYSEDGDEQSDSDDDPWGTGEPARKTMLRPADAQSQPGLSPTFAYARLANTFARVGSLVSSSMASTSTSPGRPESFADSIRQASLGHGHSTRTHYTDAELEAEAEREREHSRREAERILTMEAEERRRLEEKVLALLAPPPSSTPANQMRSGSGPPSPASTKNSGKESWWSIAKQRLTPTKEPPILTPAQQIIADTKAREKEDKAKEKERQKEDKKRGDKGLPEIGGPSYASLPAPATPVPLNRSLTPTPSPSVRPASTPQRQQMAPIQTNNLTPSPMPPRMSTSTLSTPGGSVAPDAVSQYTQFTPQGTLDVPGTLVAIANRFEKLEKWTVGHVRALEDRMKDVERYLVEKETPEEKLREDMTNLRKEMGTLEVGLSEAKRDIAAKLVAITPPVSAPILPAPPTVNAAPPPVVASQPPPSPPSPPPPPPPTTAPIVPPPPTTSEQPPREEVPERSPLNSANSQASIESRPQAALSPQHTASILDPTTSRTRLPYPTGDYVAPLMASSPSRPSSPTLISMPSLLQRISSPPPVTPTKQPLPLPPTNSRIITKSPSPTPRKRYTIALAGRDESPSPPPSTSLELSTEDSSRTYHTAVFSTSPPRPGHSATSSTTSFSSASSVLNEQATPTHDRAPTIGSTPITLSRLSTSPPPNVNGKLGAQRPSSAVNASPTPRTPSYRARAQSAYQLDAVISSTPGTPEGSDSPSRFARRTKSSDRLVGLGLNYPALSGSGTSEKTPFVDPLVIRRREQENKRNSRVIADPGLVRSPTGAKVPVGHLRAFFDAQKS